MTLAVVSNYTFYTVVAPCVIAVLLIIIVALGAFKA